jgi:hypothetical protein
MPTYGGPAHGIRLVVVPKLNLHLWARHQGMDTRQHRLYMSLWRFIRRQAGWGLHGLVSIDDYLHVQATQLIKVSLC